MPGLQFQTARRDATIAAVELKRVRTPILEIAYGDHGPVDGTPVVLLHGFPYDVHTYDEVTPGLVAAGCRVLVPFVRGYGPTRFLSAETIRSGQQGALGRDVLDFLDAVGLARALLVGYDWGGRAACIVAALWPERVQALVTIGGYAIQDIPGSGAPADPEQERRLWYQYYFNTERGRAGLAAHRVEIGRLLWQLWSPGWAFTDEVYARTAASFDNPDFVDVVIHSYRHRYGTIAGDPAYDAIEADLARQPPIGVPTINMWGDEDGVWPLLPGPDTAAAHFTGPYERRIVGGRTGHNLAQERPETVIQAVLDLV